MNSLFEKIEAINTKSDNAYYKIREDIKNRFTIKKQELDYLEKENFILTVYSLATKLEESLYSAFSSHPTISNVKIALNTHIDTSFYPSEVSMTFYVKGDNLTKEVRDLILNSSKDERFNMTAINTNLMSDEFFNNTNIQFDANPETIKSDIINIMLHDKLKKELQAGVLASELNSEKPIKDKKNKI